MDKRIKNLKKSISINLNIAEKAHEKFKKNYSVKDGLLAVNALKTANRSELLIQTREINYSLNNKK